ncbi:protein FAM217B isoform X1 [Saccopteryx bilineata]|uniref:protein FAM217B isoform X1 n=2 Tax=Saccopteryx bilineata TaxID=59482 RepID=UPI00338DFD6D
MNSGGEESFPNIRGIKKSLPQVSSSSRSLSKNISSATEKTVHPTLEDDQPCDFFKKGSRVKESHQKSGSMDAGPSWTQVQRSKSSSGRRQSKLQAPRVPSRLDSSLLGVSQAAREELGGSTSPQGKAERSPLGLPRCQGASGSQLFLDFQSLRILKEDSDEDSASDLSDSERVPIPPSPRPPPDLRLRAEEIDPVCFDRDLHAGQGHAGPEYGYPDFLPPPCNCWDLRDMAVLVHAEHRPGAVPRVGGALGRYVDRLVQLEWLQIQTVQGERGKGAKARPAAGGPAGPLKSPGRSRLVASGAVARVHQDGPPKTGPSRKKGFFPHEEDHPSCHCCETSLKPLDVLGGSRLCAQKQTLDVRTEDKKKKRSQSPRPLRWEPAGSDSGPRMESSGNIRVPKQPVLILDPADAHKASRTPARANLKKKGTADSCGHASLSGEKKLRTNGGKQNARTSQ